MTREKIETMIVNFKKEAELGTAWALYNLGYSYYYGCLGVEQNYEEAVKWWVKAAEQGDADAEYNLNFFKNKVKK